MLPKRELFCSKIQGAANLLFCFKNFILAKLRKVLMAENENRSAVEMAASIGSEPSKVDQNWVALGNINIFSILENLGEEIGITKTEWQKILSQAGLWMVNGLDNKIVGLQNKVVEQTTAVELRKMFGVPLSLLAMPVFVELEKMELNARTDLKQEAFLTSQIWEQIRNRLLYMVQLFLAEQINLVEEENLAHKAALVESKKQAEGVSGLAETMEDLEEQFRLKMKDLEKKKNLLVGAFIKVKGNIVNSVEQVFETTIFSANSQSLLASSVK